MKDIKHKKKKPQILTILYHEAVDSSTDSGFQRPSANAYKHGIKEFKDNIDIIVKNTDNFITYRELKETKKEKNTMLSFDDGGKSSMLIADYLDQFNLKGHFFITTSLIGDPFFLKETEIVALHKRGHIIGSHSHSHPNVFNSLSYETMIEEWRISKKILEDLLKCKVDCCSIPGGDANKDTYKSAIACGYEYIFNSEPTVKVHKINNTLILGRVCPKKGTSYSEIEKLSNFQGLRRLKIIREFKKIAKTLIYPIYSNIHNNRRHKN